MRAKQTLSFSFSFPITFSSAASKVGTISILSHKKQHRLFSEKQTYPYALSELYVRHSFHKVFFNYLAPEHFIIKIFTGLLNI